MKYALGLVAAVALFGAASLPAFADECPVTTAHVEDGGTTPPVCLLADTKTQHPDWYRDGGYCAGGTTIINSTGFTSGEECFG